MPRWLPSRLHVPELESFASPVDGLMALCRWFIRLRWLAVAALVVIVSVTRWAIGIKLPLRELFGLGAVLAVYNILFFWYLESLTAKGSDGVSYRTAERFANVQVLADLVCMTVLLHFSGGVENPLSVFYIFHVIIASIMLPKGQSYLQALFAFCLFTALVLLEYYGVVRHHHLEGYISEPQYRSGPYIFGHLGVLAVTLVMSAFFTTSIVARLRERQAALATTSARLAELEARKSRFMRVAAHQLRAPLSAIHSLLTVVLRGYESMEEEKRLEMVARAENRTRLMLDLLADLLSLSRLRDAREEGHERDLVAIDELLGRVIELYRPQAEEKHQDFHTALRAPQARVLGEPDRLRDVFTNLVSNAVKYTPERGRVSVTTRADDTAVVCEVEDDGIGIPPEDQAHLFEEFFRASNAREFAREGTGLGLSIVREVVEVHGGRVTCESEPGEGTRFTVTLPLALCPLPRRRGSRAAPR